MTFERICEAIVFDGLSVNSVAVSAEIPQSSLQRFCSGQQGLQMDGLRKVCDVLGLELVRRFTQDELREYLSNGWEDAWREIDTDDYDTQKTEAWNEDSQRLWAKHARKKKLDDNDHYEYREWELEAYAEWSREYDQEHYGDWATAAQEAWAAEETERLRECNWIIIED